MILSDFNKNNYLNTPQKREAIRLIAEQLFPKYDIYIIDETSDIDNTEFTIIRFGWYNISQHSNSIYVTNSMPIQQFLLLYLWPSLVKELKKLEKIADTTKFETILFNKVLSNSEFNDVDRIVDYILKWSKGVEKLNKIIKNLKINITATEQRTEEGIRISAACLGEKTNVRIKR